MSEFKADSIPIVHSEDVWYESVNVEALSEEAKRLFLRLSRISLVFQRLVRFSI